jgi:hypothetical protein
MACDGLDDVLPVMEDELEFEPADRQARVAGAGQTSLASPRRARYAS